MDFFCNLHYRLIDSEKNPSVLKQMTYFAFDNNPILSIKYHINPNNPENVCVSSKFKRYKKNEVIYIFDSSCLRNSSEKEIETWKYSLFKYHIEMKKRHEKDIILNHIMFLNSIYKTYFDGNMINYKVSNFKTKEEVKTLIMEKKPLIEIFDTLKTWLSIPFIRLQLHDKIFIKENEYFEQYLLDYEEYQYEDVRMKMQKMKEKHYKNYFEIEIFQLDVEKEIAIKKSNKNPEKLTLKRVISIKDFYQEDNNKLHLQVYLNTKYTLLNRLEQVICFLNLQKENIIETRDFSFTGELFVPVESLPFEKYIPFEDGPEIEQKCEKCFDSMTSRKTWNVLEKKIVGNFCEKCFQLYHVEYNLRRMLNMTHFDGIVQFFFQYANFSQIENEHMFMLNFKHSHYENNLSVRVSINKKNEFHFYVKKSCGPDQIQIFLQCFFKLLLTIQKRKKYYFLNYHSYDTNLKNYIRINEISDIFVISVKEFDKQLFDDNDRNQESSLMKAICPQEDMKKEEKFSCKEVLKHFLYTRYCDKKRMPYISFEKPNEEEYNIITWPNTDKFSKENKFTIFLKSPKYKYPIRISQTYTNSFTMVIKQDTNKKLTEEKVVEFSLIYFYIEKKSKKYLSVTNLSPGFLPSITMKQKTNEDCSNYMTKKRKLEKKLDDFFVSFCNDPDAKFYMEKKYSLEDILKAFQTEQVVSDRVSTREKLYFKVSDQNKFTDIKFVYHYCCHLLQANIIVLHTKNKNTVYDFKSICDLEKWHFTFFDRFLFLIESVDDKNNEGMISHYYQPICYQKNNQVFYFFDRKKNKEFFLDLMDIYQHVILNSNKIFDWENMKQLEQTVASQTVDCYGNTKYLHFVNGMIAFLSTNIPFLDKNYQFKLKKESILSMKNIQELHAKIDECFPFPWHPDKNYALDDNLYVYTVTVSIENDVNIKTGFLYFFEELSNSNITQQIIPELYKKEILYYFEKKTIHDLTTYKDSFIHNNICKQEILKKYLRFVDKKKKHHLSNKTLVKDFLKKHILFTNGLKDYIHTKRQRKMKVPECYQYNLRYYLEWFSNLTNKKQFMQNLEKKFLYTFQFSKKENTIINIYE